LSLPLTPLRRTMLSSSMASKSSKKYKFLCKIFVNTQTVSFLWPYQRMHYLVWTWYIKVKNKIIIKIGCMHEHLNINTWSERTLFQVIWDAYWRVLCYSVSVGFCHNHVNTIKLPVLVQWQVLISGLGKFHEHPKNK
jgi:hypothetical protein